MTPQQPRSALAQTASTVPPRDREAARLLALWVDLTVRLASAAAHHSSDEPSLRNLQIQIEEALVDHLADSDAVMAELWAWEATLLHVVEMPPETCLICRKARLGLPADVPLPAGIGGVR
ncbi:hypothetical protein [Nocardioides sp.]|uniref:hypothetical protein n=1 Tax=Nocardioides sp. TaxID=35761 RepID=UPI0037840F35